MNAENFCYWLQGKLELDPSDNRLSEEQVKMIREHLALVFVKKTEQPFQIKGSILDGIIKRGDKMGSFDDGGTFC